MAGNFLPIVLLGGTAIAFGSKKKRKRRSRPPVSEETREKLEELTQKTGEFVEERSPNLRGETVEESSLELEEKPSGPAAGEFEIEKTDLEYDEEDDFEQQKESLTPQEKSAQQKEKCDTFIEAIHITPTEQNELPIKKVAVEQSILPAMEASAQAFAQSLGTPLDEETVGPRLVLSGLESIAPDCDWEFSDEVGEFRYAGGQSIADSEKLMSVLNAMIDLSVLVLGRFNEKVQ